MVELRASTADVVWGADRTTGNSRWFWPTFWTFIAVGTVLTLLNLSLPITRNALCYAKDALGIMQNNFNLLATAHDPAWTSGKPILFSLIAAPIVWLTNANTGTILASFVGTAFFLAMTAVALGRLNRRAGIDPKLAPLELLFVACNPLVLYQFWSAYPDALFAGLVVLAFVLTDIIATEPERDTRWHIVGLGATIFMAIHTKLYGAILGLTCPIYLLMHGRALLTRSRYFRAKLSILLAMFAGLALVLLAAKLNLYPLLKFDDAAGFGGYVNGLLLKSNNIVLSLYMLGFALLLNFHAALLLFLPSAARRAWKWAPTLFALIYLLGLLTFDGTYCNMRYFLPALPFMAPALARGAQSIGSLSRSAILVIYSIVACSLVGIFNVASIEKLVNPVLPNPTVQYTQLATWLDNLRLPVQMALEAQTNVINTSVPDGSTFYWSSDYYGTASHGLAKDLGVKSSLDIRYVLTPSQIPASPYPVYMIEYWVYDADSKLEQVPDWATVQNLGHGVFRLDPVAIDLMSEPHYSQERAPIRLRADIKSSGLLKTAIATVEFFDGDRRIGSSSQQPFELEWPDPTPGRHEIRASASYGQKNASISRPLVVYIGSPAIDRGVGTAGYLATESRNGEVLPVDHQLELGANQSLSAIYFDKLELPPRAHIAKAYLQLNPGDSDSQAIALEIQAERSANSPPIQFEHADLSRRPRTTASVKWSPQPWTTTSGAQRSPDLSPILEEVLAQAQWQSGNNLMLLIHGSGRRFMQITTSEMQNGPRLYVELSRD